MNVSKANSQYELTRPLDLLPYPTWAEEARSWRDYWRWLEASSEFLPYSEFSALLGRESRLYKDLFGDMITRRCGHCGK